MTDRDRLAALLHFELLGCNPYPGHLELHSMDADRLIAAGVTLVPAPPPDALRAALLVEIGRRLTDARVDELIRAAGVPLHGRPPSVDLQARYVAASIRVVAQDIVDAALAATTPAFAEAPAEAPLDVDRLARALAHERAGVRTSWEGWVAAARKLAAEYAALQPAQPTPANPRTEADDD